MPDVRYDLTGDATELIGALQDVVKALNKLTVTTKKADDAVEDLDRDTKKAGKAMVGTSKDAQKLKHGLEGAKQGATAMGGKVGEMAGRVEAAGKGMMELAAATGPVGVGIAAVVVAAGAAVIGLAALAAGVVGVVDAAHELSGEMEDLEKAQGFDVLEGDGKRALETVGGAFDAIKDQIKALVVLVGADFAQTIERASMIVVGLLDGVVFRLGQTIEETSLLKDGFAKFFDIALLPLNALVHYLGMVAKAVIVVKDMLGQEISPDAIASAELLSNFSAGAIVAEGWGIALDGLQNKFGEAEARGRQLTTRLADVTKETKKATKATEELTEIDYSDIEKAVSDQADYMEGAAAAVQALRDAEEARNRASLSGADLIDENLRIELERLDELAEKYKDNAALVAEVERAKTDAIIAANDAQVENTLTAIDVVQEAMLNRYASGLEGQALLDAQYAAEMERLDELAVAYQDNADVMAAIDWARISAKNALEEKSADLVKEKIKEGLDLSLDATDQILGSFQDYMQAKLDSYDTDTAEGRKAYRKAFKIQQGLALAQAIVQGGLALLAAWNAGPVAAIAAVPVVTTQIATTIATIKNTEPEFPIGSAYVAPPTPDHTVSARLREGEAVLTDRAVNAVGGPAAVDRLNAGQGSGQGPTAFQLIFRGRVMDTILSEVLSAPGATGDLLSQPAYGLATSTR